MAGVVPRQCGHAQVCLLLRLRAEGPTPVAEDRDRPTPAQDTARRPARSPGRAPGQPRPPQGRSPLPDVGLPPDRKPPALPRPPPTTRSRSATCARVAEEVVPAAIGERQASSLSSGQGLPCQSHRPVPSRRWAGRSRYGVRRSIKLPHLPSCSWTGWRETRRPSSGPPVKVAFVLIDPDFPRDPATGGRPAGMTELRRRVYGIGRTRTSTGRNLWQLPGRVWPDTRRSPGVWRGRSRRRGVGLPPATRRPSPPCGHVRQASAPATRDRHGVHRQPATVQRSPGW